MAEKLSESVWTAFAKKRDLDDGALVKALKAFDKTDESKPEPRLDALDEVIAQIKKLVVALPKKKPPLPDKEAKEVKDKLYALLDAAEGLQKDAQAAKAAAESEDDEPDTPVLLTKKMVPLLRELKKGNGAVRMNAMICTAGKATAVLIMRRSISPARRKLLAEYVDAKGGMKYIVGEVLYENKALTFVVQSQAGGLAKRLRQALLDQVELRFKVKVRGDDGEEADGEEEDEREGGEGAPGSDGAQAGGTPGAPPKPATAEELSYTQRLRKVRPAWEQALKDQHPEATKLRAVMGFASEKAAAEDFAGAIKALQMVEKLLATPVPQGGQREGEGRGEGPGVDPGAGFSARLAALLPRIKEAIAAAGPDAATLKLKSSEAGALAKQGRYEQGQALLDEVEGLLEKRTPDSGKETASQPSRSEDPQRREFEEIVSRLEDDFEALVRAPLPPALAEQFGPVNTAWTLAQEAAKAGNLQRALLIVKRLADSNAIGKLSAAVRAAPTDGEGADTGRLVRQRQFMLQRWARIPGELRAELQGLRQTITQSEADEDPAGLMEAIETELDELIEELQDLLDDAVNAGDTSMLLGARSRLETDALIRHLQSGPGVDGKKLLGVVLGALDEIESAMTRE